MESRSAEDNTTDVGVNGDITIQLTPTWTPLFSGAANLSIQNNALRTHVVSKVVRYPAILRNVLTYTDGVYHMSENVAFNLLTGSPMITRTVDGYDRLTLEQAPSGQNGSYHNYEFPATDAFPQLGQKVFNQRGKIYNGGSLTIRKSLSISGKPYLSFSSSDASTLYHALGQLGTGDLIHLTLDNVGNSDGGFYHVDTIAGATAYLLPVSASTFAGINTDTNVTHIEILESGRANQPAATVGMVVTYGESPDSVRLGTNFGTIEVGNFSARHRFVDTLNARFARGGGFITPAEMTSWGVKLWYIGDTGGVHCAYPVDSIRLAVTPLGVSLAMGNFAFVDSICGTPAVPHPMIAHLNHYLDTLWGFNIPTTYNFFSSQCDSVSYRFRSYSVVLPAYHDLSEALLATTFDAVNGLNGRRVNQSIIAGTDAYSVNDGVLLSGGSAYRATGTIHLQSATVTSQSVRSRMWVSRCNAADTVKEVSLRRNNELASLIDFSTPFIGISSHDIDTMVLPYTSKIGAFAEDSSGYLIYRDVYDTGTTERAFGVRFFHRDTAMLGGKQDLLSMDGGKGHFDLASDGALIYIPANAALPSFMLGAVQFCPDTLRRY
ncbi:MAG: hypothetical protein ABI876_16210, partial [Bacteroidota bacterium]